MATVQTDQRDPLRHIPNPDLNQSMAVRGNGGIEPNRYVVNEFIHLLISIEKEGGVD